MVGLCYCLTSSAEAPPAAADSIAQTMYELILLPELNDRPYSDRLKLFIYQPYVNHVGNRYTWRCEYEIVTGKYRPNFALP